jgi:hypothetical protein
MASLVSMNVNGFKVKGPSLVLLSTMCIWFFTLRMGSAQNPVQRDQQALAILSQSIAAAGGLEQITSIQDFTETGTVTYYWAGQPVGNVTVKSRGLHEFRIDADLPDGRRSTVVSGYGGSIKEVNGWTRPLHRQSAVDIGSITFPYLPLIAAVQDPSTSIIYGGLVTHDGASVHDIRIQKVYSKQQDPSGNRGIREARDFYVDASSYLVVEISDQIYVGNRSTPHEVLYSNYKPESGVSMPMTITETVRGVTGVAMRLNQVAFNSQLSDSDFSW